MAALGRRLKNERGSRRTWAKVFWMNPCSIRQESRVLVFSARRQRRVAMRLITNSQITAHNKVSSAWWGDRAATWPRAWGSVGLMDGWTGVVTAESGISERIRD